MPKSSNIKLGTISAAVALVLTAGLVGYAPRVVAQQGGAVFADHLLAQGPMPKAAAQYARTQNILIAAGGEVRATQGASADFRAGDLVHSSGAETILRVRVDARRDRLWVLDTAAVHVVDLPTKRRIRSVSLRNWMHVDDSTNCLPDLQLDSSGAALISDNVQTKLWRVDGDDFSVVERTVRLASHRTLDVGFSALAITESGEVFATMAAPGLVWRVDKSLTRAEVVRSSTSTRGSCATEAVPASAVASSRTRRTQPGHFAVRAVYYKLN